MTIVIDASDQAHELIERHAGQLAGFHPGERRFISIALSAEPKACSALRAVVTAFLAHTVPGDDLEDILLALDEAVANAMRHSGTSAPIRVHVGRGPGAVQVIVHDAGRGFDVAAVERGWPPALDATSGRGLFLISRLMDSSFAYSGGGTMIRMIRCVPSAA
jgi:anti-sigma regulatory factor (Ser/Thr protein kinase)